MKASITVTRRDTAVVSLIPSWLDRLLGEKIEDRVAVAFPALPRGARLWHWDSNGRLVPHWIARLIEQEVVAQEWKRILAK